MAYIAYQYVQSRSTGKPTPCQYGEGETPEDAIFDATHVVTSGGQVWAKQYAPNKCDLRTATEDEFEALTGRGNG